MNRTSYFGLLVLWRFCRLRVDVVISIDAPISISAVTQSSEEEGGHAHERTNEIILNNVERKQHLSIWSTSLKHGLCRIS